MNDGQAVSQKVAHNEVVAMGAHTAGTYSRILKGISELPQHSVALSITGSVTGVVSVRARPVGASGFTKLNMEAVNLATADTLCWSITGFFDAFALVVSTGIGGAGGAVQLTVGSCTKGL